MFFLLKVRARCMPRYGLQEPDDSVIKALGFCIDSQRKGRRLQRIPTRKLGESL